MGNLGPRFRLRPLCTCLAATSTLLFAETAFASTVSFAALSAAAERVQRGVASALLGSIVTNCSDGLNPGTLRYLVAHAGPGDTIDLGNCPEISLSAAIVTPQFAPLTISGGGSIIHASAVEPAFASLSDLTLVNLTINGGAAVAVLGEGDKVGGALVAGYNLTLQNSTVSGGVAKGKGGKGGSIYAFGNLMLQNSTVSGGSAVLAGGCIYGKDSVVLDHSTVTGCSAKAYSLAYYNMFIYSFGGAIVASSVTLTNASQVSSSFSLGSPACSPYTNCFIFGYEHDEYAGGIKTGPFTCIDSRVSGNAAPHSAGISASSASLQRCTVDNNFVNRHFVYSNDTAGSGMLVSSSAEIVNSTIVFNGSGINASGNVMLVSSTVDYNCLGGVSSASLFALSSIVAKNGPGVPLYYCHGSDVNAAVMSGGDNLVIAANVSQAPPPGVVTLTVDPLLLPLDFNGGPTPTQALDPASPARDKGNNYNQLASDQRGAGFVRMYGRPDIGAYEWQVEGDEILYDGFEYGAR